MRTRKGNAGLRHRSIKVLKRTLSGLVMPVTPRTEGNSLHSDPNSPCHDHTS